MKPPVARSVFSALPRLAAALILPITAGMLVGSGAALADSLACKADLTGNGVVNFGDLAVLKAVFFQTCTDPGPRCGNGVAEGPMEQCDDRNLRDGDGCSSTCAIEVPLAVVCGKGIAQGPTETCDDGNVLNGDGCSSSCTVELPMVAVCGDGFAVSPEQCDDGNLANGDGCSSACTIEGPLPLVCGDAMAVTPEQCDDGNVANGDGCSATCTIEPPLAGGRFPATGQTTCWNSSGTITSCTGTGQDGEIRAGATLAYVDNGDGTITDTNTGLMWEKLSYDGTIHSWGNTYTWDNAFGVKIATLNGGGGFAGHGDWRVPNIKELQSIVNYEIPSTGPTVAAAFNTGCTQGCTVTSCSCTQSLSYWSSSSYVFSPDAVWLVGFNDGNDRTDFKSYGPYYVRAVRGGL